MARTILIVDDNAIDRKLLQSLLKNNYDIITAESGLDMITLLRERGKSFSAILLDLVMPEMDGFGALRKIRDNAVYRQIPVIVTTSQTDDDTQVRALSLGAAGFAVKPYNKEILLNLLENLINLREKSALSNAFRMDTLTGLMNRTFFFESAEAKIKRKEEEYYILTCLDIENFKVINDQYGIDAGDKVLKFVAKSISESMLSVGGICCRDAADKFGMLYPVEFSDSDAINNLYQRITSSNVTGRNIRIRVGRYLVEDISIPVSTMYDRATMAEESIRGRYDTYIAYYTDDMRTHLLEEQRIVNDMDEALANGEFEPWFQPQYNHMTGALIGAEALVRWRKDGRIVSPNDFIPVFERNGFIYEVDQYIWRRVCVLLRRWLNEGKSPLPVSVNVSRYDLLQSDFLDVITGLVKEYNLPVDLLRLEITESAFTELSNTIMQMVNELINKGFTVEIDDFGSGYSSLNTLKDVPAAILKLDMKFFENTENSQRSGNIVESVVRMAKWLGMAVIAEGVEEPEQADYLRTIGCYYIQGYLYSKPVPLEEYENVLKESTKEPKLTRLETLKTLDNNEFWNPKSMDTLIFNSYVGAACILECSKGKVEMIRATDHYVKILGSTCMNVKDVLALDWAAHMDEYNLRLFSESVVKSKEIRESVIGEYEFHDIPGCPQKTYLRVTVRVIATAGERYLIYCLSDNITAQRAAESEALIYSERISAVMDNSHSGITATVVKEEGKVEYLFVNDRFYELLGYTKEQFEAEVSSPFDCILPEDRTPVFEATTKLKEIGSTITLRMRDIRRDGSVIWLRCDTSVVKFNNVPEPVQLSSFMDITEQVENEMKHLESAQKLEIIMSNINGGVSAIQIYDDGTSNFVFNNEKYYELYGYTREQAEEEHLDVMTLILPEDMEMVMDKVKKLKQDKQPVLIDYRIIKRDGRFALLRANASLMGMPGFDDEVITSVVTDITEKKSMEDKLEAIITNINGGVSAVYLNEKKPEFVIANDKYYDTIGYTKEQFENEIVNIFDLIHPDDREQTEKEFMKVREEKGQQYTMEYRVVRRDGSVRDILCNTSIIHLFGIDKPVQLAVSNDITELREAQRKEHSAMDRLQTVMNVMSNGMTAVAFHDEGMQFIFANNRYYEIHGIKRGSIGEEHLSNVLTLVVPEDRDMLRNTVKETVKTGQTAKSEYRIQRPDGEVRWVKAVINVTNLAGIEEPVQVTVFTDITDIKEANNQLRFLNDSARIILAEPDSDKAIKETLKSIMTYFSADRGYVVELDYSRNVSNNTYEVCADSVSSEMQNLQNIPFGSSDFWYDTLCRHKFLTIENVNAMGDSKRELKGMLLAQGIQAIILAPLWREGRLIGFVGVDNPTKATGQITQLTALADYITFVLTRRDMSRKIAHDIDAIETLMNDTPGGFVRMAVHPGTSPTIVSLNEGMCRMLGMTNEEAMEAYGNDVHRFFTPEEIEETEKKVMSALSSCGQYSCKCTLHCKGEKKLRVMAFGRFVRDEKGSMFLNSYFTDISEQMLAEEKQKMLLDNMPTGAAMYEFDGKDLTVIHINKSYWKLVERQSVDYGKTSIIKAVHPDDREMVYQEICAAIRQNRNAGVDARILCGGHEYRPFNLAACITRQNDGKYILYVSYSLMRQQFVKEGPEN